MMVKRRKTADEPGVTSSVASFPATTIHRAARWLDQAGRSLNQSAAVAALALGAVCLVALPAAAQHISPVQLDSPILPPAMPAGTEMAAAPVGTSLAQPAPTADFGGCASCGSIGCDGCGSGRPGFAVPNNSVGLWIRADYLSWREKDSDLIPMITTSGSVPSSAETLLSLAASETNVVFGQESVDDNPLEGWRFEIGSWLDGSATAGIMARFFDVGDREVRTQFGPNDANFLGVPIFEVDSGAERAILLSVPNERRGEAIAVLSGSVSGWEVLYRKVAQTGPNFRVDRLVGYRNFSLDERLTLNTRSLFTATGQTTPENSLTTSEDDFRFENTFHGLDFGLTGHSHEGNWSLDFMAKIALGFVDQQQEINGFQLNSAPNVDAARLVGGIFSQESNIGKHDQSEFAWMPEVNVNLGYALTGSVDLTVGYTFMYISDVVRANSIDRSVDTGLLADLAPVNANRPEVKWDTSSYWIHGLNIGLTGRF